MGTFSRLLRRLHSVFDKEPGKVAVIRAEGTGLPVWIDAEYLYAAGTATVGTTAGLSTSGSGRTSGGLSTRIVQPAIGWSLESMTVQGVVDALNTLTGVTATLLRPDMAAHSAWVLLDRPVEDLSEEPHFYYPTSLLWLEMATYGRMLDEQAARLGILEDQFYPDTASEHWLDYWGRDLFGIPRDDGEDDTAYARRMVNEILRPVPNNVALEKAIEDATGIGCTISDAKALESLTGDPLIFDVGSYRFGMSGLVFDSSPNLSGLTDLECQFLVELKPPITMDPDDVAVLVQRGLEIAHRWKAAGTGIIESLTNQVGVEDSVAGSDSLLLELDVAVDDGLVDGPAIFDGAWIFDAPRLVFDSISSLEEQVFVEELDAGGSPTDTQFV